LGEVKREAPVRAEPHPNLRRRLPASSGFDAILIFATAVFPMAAWTGDGKTIFFANRFFSLETILLQYSYSFSRHDLI
jgi:hypothetical protein